MPAAVVAMAFSAIESRGDVVGAGYVANWRMTLDAIVPIGDEHVAGQGRRVFSIRIRVRPRVTGFAAVGEVRAMIKARVLEPNGGNLNRINRKKQGLLVAGCLRQRCGMTLLTRAIDMARGTLQLFLDELRSGIGKQTGAIVAGDTNLRVSFWLVALLADDLGEDQIPN